MVAKNLNTTVVGLQTRPVATSTPVAGQVLGYNGASWVPVTPAVTGFPVVGPNPPTNPVQGQLWWDVVSGQLFVFYNDGTSAQWVVANVGVNGQQGPVGPAGPVPLAFSFAGNPSVNFGIGLAIVAPYNIAGNLAGSVGRCINAPTTSAATFTITKLSGTNSFAFGTITFPTGSQTGNFSGAGGPLAIGDVLRVLCTATDANFTDASMTILAART